MYCTIEGGKKISMPRYYKDKIYDAEERGYIKGQFERILSEKMEKDARSGNVRTYHENEELKKRNREIMYFKSSKNEKL